MKILRVTTESNQTAYCVETEKGFMRAEGSLETGWTASTTEINPLKFLPPIAPVAIFAIGLNYREHAVEMGQKFPEHPVVTAKNLSSAIGHKETVYLPRFLKSDSVDFEVELAVVIGKPCKNILAANALDYVAGYMTANDVSARDWQKIYSGGQWVRGKSFDTFCPLGPYFVTADEIPNPNDLNMSLELNGEVMQSSNTSDMIFDVKTLVAFLSGSTTLLPGTVILTGTPPGVGAARKPPVYLKDGDQMVTIIESIGKLENPIKEESL